MRPCDEVLKETLKLAQSMLTLAERGDQAREDNGCGVLYGVLRDAAYNLRKLAEQEKAAHIKKGWWNE
jgi:hypothetical protein